MERISPSNRLISLIRCRALKRLNSSEPLQFSDAFHEKFSIISYHKKQESSMFFFEEIARQAFEKKIWQQKDQAFSEKPGLQCLRKALSEEAKIFL